MVKIALPSDVAKKVPWTPEEDDVLRREYRYASQDTLHELLPYRTWDGIAHRAQDLRLKRSHTKTVIGILKEIDKAYFAGLFDGEGYISVKKTKRGPKIRSSQHRVFIGLGMVDPFNPLYLQHIFGGVVRKRTHPKLKPFYEWIAWGYEAEEALKQLYQYLMTKKRQAKLALILRFLEFKRSSDRVTPSEIVKMRDKISGRIRDLNEAPEEL
jgi:hypothetical protein